MGESTQPACPRCAAVIEPGAAACDSCGLELESTSPAAKPLAPMRSSAPRLPRSSSPPPRASPRAAPPQTTPAGFTPAQDASSSDTDAVPKYVPPLASPSPLADLPDAGTQTRNDRVALDPLPEGNDQTHPSLDPLPAVVTSTAPAAAPLVEQTTPLGKPLAEVAQPTAAILSPVSVANEATHLKLEPVAAEPELTAPSRPSRTLVWLGSFGTAAMVLALVLAFMPHEAPAPQVVELPAPVEAKEAPKEAPTGTEKTEPAVASSHPAPSYGDPLDRKAAFYPDHPTDLAKRGIAPSRRAPAKGTLRVISTVRGNLVAAPLSVDHMPVGMTPQELRNLKPGLHLFEVLTGDGPPVTVHYPVTAEKRQKTGEILDIDITQDGETKGVGQLDARADRPMHQPAPRGGK